MNVMKKNGNFKLGQEDFRLRNQPKPYKENKKGFAIFSPEHPFSEFMIKLGWTVIFNALWLICCLPLFTIGAATTALYTVMLNLTAEKTHHMISLFFQSFKMNFFHATTYWLLLALAGGICYIDLSYFYHMGGTFGIFCMIVAGIVTLIYLCILVTIFPVISKFRTTWKDIIKTTCYIIRRHFKAILVCVIISALVLFLMYNIVLFYYMIIFGYGLVAFILSYIFNKIFDQYTDNDK